LVAILYLVAGNILLRTRLLRDAISGSKLGFAFSGSATTLQLNYESAYTLTPGRVHVHGLSIRGRERALEWFVSLDHADVDISLTALLYRVFRATRVQASGLVVRARLRLTHDEATPGVVATLPSIPGLADPPLLDDSGPGPPPLTDAAYNLWSVNLEKVDVEHVREVWIQSGRSEGDTRVRGRWLFRPQRWLDVGPAVVDSNGVDFSYGGLSLVRGLHGSIRATIHPFDIRQTKGLAVLDSISLVGTQHGTLSILHAMNLLAKGSGVTFERGDSPIDATMAVDHGALVPGTRVRSDAVGCAAEAAGLLFDASIRMDLDVDSDGATAKARVSDLVVSSSRVERARAASIVAQVTTHHLRLARAFDDAGFIVDIGGAATNDIAEWKPLIPRTIAARSGRISADAHADGSLAERRGNANINLSALHLTVERGVESLTSDIAGTAQVTDLSLAEGWTSGSATVAANHMAVRIGPAMVASTGAIDVVFGRATWEAGGFALSNGSAILRDASAWSPSSGRALFVMPFLSAVARRVSITPSGTSGHVSLDIPVARLPNLGVLRELVPRATALAIESGNGRATLHANMDLSSRSLRGAATLVAQGVRARAGATELFGDLHLTVRARHDGGAEDETDISETSLVIDNAGTGTADLPDDRWWGKAVLRRGALRIGGGLRVDATVHIDAKDALPATALVSQNAGVPPWATAIFRMPQLRADAQVRLSPSSFEVRSLVARGGTTSLRAEYSRQDGHEDGCLLMGLGWTDLGYGLGDSGSGLVLVGAESWFAREVAAKRRASADPHDAHVAWADFRSA